MSSAKIKIIIIGILVFVIVLLLVLKAVFIKSIPDHTGKKEEAKNLTEDEIKNILPKKLDSIFMTFGLKKEWVGERNENDTKFAFWKNVDLPEDVSALQIEAEVENLIIKYNLYARSSEDFPKPHLYTDIFQKTTSSEKIIGRINYSYHRDSTINRETSDICIVLNGLEKMNIGEVDKVLNSGLKYSIIFPNNIERSDVQALILDSKMDYILLFEIGMPEDFASDFKKDKDWRSKLYSVCGDYDKEIPIVFTNPKKQYEFETELISELLKCKNNNVFRDTVFRKITPTEKTSGVELLFADIKMKLEKGVKKIIYFLNINYSEFNFFLNECTKLERRGCKLKTFSAMTK